MDGIEALKKYKNLPLRDKVEGKPLFKEDGNFSGEIETSEGKVNLEDKVKPVKEPARDETVAEDIEGPYNDSEWPERPVLPSGKCILKFPETPETETSPGKRTCQYCENTVYNSQTICDKCKEKRFQEIWTEILDPLLEKQGFFIKKDIMEIDFPMALNNALTWYIKNDYITMRKNGRINEYYRPNPEEEGQTPVQGITKECRDCNEIKPVNEFYKQKRSPDGYSYICKTCDKKKNRDRPRTKKEPDTLHNLEGLIIDDLQRQHKKHHPIALHLYVLSQLELIKQTKK
jgi:hypothetical protein